MRRGGNTRAAPQHHLPAHEFAVILAERSCQRSKSRIAKISARRPLPAIAKHLCRTIRNRFQGYGFQMSGFQKIPGHELRCRRRLPFRLGCQPLAGPMSVGIRFEIADVGDGTARNLRQLSLSAQGTYHPISILFAPVEWRCPALRLHGLPPNGEP